MTSTTLDAKEPCRTDLKEREAASISEVVPPALCQQEVVVHAGQALPGDQVKVELILLVQTQLLHHLGKEGGVLLVVAACAILLQRTRSSDCTHALLSATVQCAASCYGIAADDGFQHPSTDPNNNNDTDISQLVLL